LWAQSSREERHELERRAADAGAPEALRALAEHYVGVEELDLALDCARQVSRVAGSAEGPVLEGRTLWKRFLRDHVAADGREALAALRRGLVIDPRSREALMLIAELCFYVGAIAQAIEAADAVLAHHPGDEAATALKARLPAPPAETAEEDELLRRVEETDAPWRGYRSADGRGAPGQVPVSDVHRMLHDLSSMAGVRKLALSRVGVDLVARDGNVFPERRSPPDPLVALTPTFRRRIAGGVKQLGIGAFQESEILLGNANILAFAGMSAVLLVELEPNARTAGVVEACRDVVGRLDGAPTEQEHA
jgi:hypothetical protein